MKISIGKSTKTFKPQNVDSLQELSQVITKTNWSCGVFKDDHRNISNFEYSDFMALDIDDGVSIEEAARRLKDYSHIIAPTKSHKTDKNGKIADRFRAVVVLTERIENQNDYYTTYNNLMQLFPEADSACKDPSRLFYPSKEVYKVQTNKDRFPIKKYEAPIAEEVEIDRETKGQLSAKTLDLLQFGAEPGTRHGRLYKASKDALENNYTIEEFTAMIDEMAARTGNWADVMVNEDDIKCITDAFNSEARYSARKTTEPTYRFQKIGELLKNKAKLDWLAANLLTRGGLSILVGPPKSGKSTLVRQLSRSVARGESFLNRRVKKGTVLILALEEQAEVLNEQFKTVGINKDDDIYVHVGRITSDKAAEDLYAATLDIKPSLIIIDTLMLFCKTQNINDYSEMNKKLEDLREIARKSNAHVLCIHHQNKSRENYGTSTILGSAAIHGAVDNAMIFSKDGARRSIQSSQRAGVPFENEELIYIPETQTYVVGKKRDFIGEEF